MLGKEYGKQWDGIRERNRFDETDWNNLTILI